MLKLQRKDQPRHAIWVVGELLSIGSGAEDNLRLQNPGVAVGHAQLITLDDRFYLQAHAGDDCTVNGKRVQKQEVRAGDVIGIGPIELLLVEPKTLSSVGPDSPTATTQWTMRAIDSFCAGQCFSINASPCVIGRGHNCNIVLPGTHLSRQHAEITVVGNLLQVRDLNSANGTYINDVRVTQGMARPGDELRLDNYRFVLLYAGDGGDKTHLREAEDKSQRSPLKTSELPPKQWKFRSTSPGNRPGEEPREPARMHIITIVLVSVALTVMVLWLGYLLGYII